MENGQYNEILNKVYFVLSNNMRLMKLLYHSQDVDIDDVENLSPSQLREVKDKYLKKLLDVSVMNGKSDSYICLKYGTIDFLTTGRGSGRSSAIQSHWNNIYLNIHVIVSNNIEIVKGVSRTLELVNEVQKSLQGTDVDAVGNCYIYDIMETRVVDGYTSMVIQTKFYNTVVGYE